MSHTSSILFGPKIRFNTSFRVRTIWQIFVSNNKWRKELFKNMAWFVHCVDRRQLPSFLFRWPNCVACSLLCCISWLHFWARSVKWKNAWNRAESSKNDEWITQIDDPDTLLNSKQHTNTKKTVEKLRNLILNVEQRRSRALAAAIAAPPQQGYSSNCWRTLKN